MGWWGVGGCGSVGVGGLFNFFACTAKALAIVDTAHSAADMECRVSLPS